MTNQYRIEDFEIGLAPEDERPEDYALALSLGNVPADPPPPVTPPPVTPPPPADPQQQATIQVPAWLQDYPEAEQPALLDAWLARLAPEQRAQLPAVAQLLEWTRGAARDDVERQMAAEREAAAAVVTLQNLMEPVAGYMTETQREAYEQTLENFQSQVANQAGAREMRAAVAAAYAQFNLPLTEIPEEVRNAAAQAPTAGQAAAIYMSYLGNVVATATEQVVVNREQGRSQANDAATMRRLEHETLGKLAKEKRIRIVPAENGEYWAALAAEAPPSLGDGVSAPNFTGFNAETYRHLNESLEAVNPDAIDAWTAQYANADA